MINRKQSFAGRRRKSVKVFRFFLPSIAKSRFSCALSFATPTRISISARRYHRTYLREHEKSSKIILGYPMHTNTHSYSPHDHPIFLSALHDLLVWKENSCLVNIFPVFSLVARNNKKFLSFEDDPLVIVGSHSKRISSFSKQRPRSFTYIVPLPYFRGSSRKKGKKIKTLKKRVFFKFNIWKWKMATGIADAKEQ